MNNKEITPYVGIARRKEPNHSSNRYTSLSQIEEIMEQQTHNPIGEKASTEEQPAVQILSNPSMNLNDENQHQKGKMTSFEILVASLFNPLEPSLEDPNSFKDAEIYLSDQSKFENLGYEGHEDFASEEVFPRKSRRHALKVLREEQA
jgi:hypothetical protein